MSEYSYNITQDGLETKPGEATRFESMSQSFDSLLDAIGWYEKNKSNRHIIDPERGVWLSQYRFIDDQISCEVEHVHDMLIRPGRRPMTSDEYKSDGGIHCPACRSSEVQNGSTDYNGPGCIGVGCTCESCGATWYENYSLEGYTELQDGE